jgi:hypothetical protein
MSSFIHSLNLIKTRRTRAWLTLSQQIAFAAVEKVLQAPSTVNLFGTIGVGKTFLAWMLADQLAYAYLPHPGQLEQFEASEINGVVLDNCYSSRQAHRNLLKKLRFHQVHYAVLVIHQYIVHSEKHLNNQITINTSC